MKFTSSPSYPTIIAQDHPGMNILINYTIHSGSSYYIIFFEKIRELNLLLSIKIHEHKSKGNRTDHFQKTQP